MSENFDEAVAVRPAGPGRWAADCSELWFSPRGANGGYLAAIVVRAVEAQLADPGRRFRSLTLHYLRPPGVGPLELEVEVERAGRTLTSVTARVTQNGKPCLLAVGALAADFGADLAFSESMPSVPGAGEIEPWPLVEQMPTVAHRVEMRPAIGGEIFGGAEEAITGGWVGLREPHRYDGALLAFMADVWLPASFTRAVDPVAVPTIDLTVHFRNPQVALETSAEEPLLGVFRSRFAADSFVEEDGELWSPGGVLLAQSRQLAVIREAK